VRRIVLFTTLLGLGLGAGVPPGEAEAANRGLRFTSIGPRAGFSIDPDQFVIGGQADFGDLFPNTTFLLPVVEVGVRDNRTTTSIGTDLFYRFRDRWGYWTPYLGGELAFLITNYDSSGNDTDTNLGLSAVAGIQKGFSKANTIGFEFKLQIIDAPQVKLMVVLGFGQ
jgi:hypothetical protein